MSFLEVRHVLMTVRKAGTLGSDVARMQAGGTSPFSAVQTGFEALRIQSEAMRASMLFGSGIAGAFLGGLGTIAALSYVSQFIQPGGQFVMPDPSKGTSYADQVRQAQLVKIYGAQEGNAIWQNEFTSRTIEVDLRSKVP